MVTGCLNRNRYLVQEMPAAKWRHRFLLPVTLIGILCACASNPTFDEGKRLIAEGQLEKGLELVRQTADANPENAEYKSYYVHTIEGMVSQWLILADTARDSRQPDAAAALYKRVLGLEPNNIRAQAGLAKLETDRRNGQLVNEAETHFASGDNDSADKKVHQVLTDDPSNRGARSLQRRIEDKLAKNTGATSVFKSKVHTPITLEFRDANLRSVFEVISNVADINFVYDKDMRSDLRTTIFVKNSTIEEAIRALLLTNQLEKKVLNDNTILIYPNTPAKLRDYQDLMVKSFYLANADAKQTLNLIKTVLKTRDAFVDEKLNLLVVRDTPESIRLVENLIAVQDLAEPEVMLQVEVLEVSRSRLEQLGLQFPSQVSYSLVGSAAASGTVTPGNISLKEWLGRNAGLVRMTVSDPAFVINLSRQDGQTNVLANPRIRVKNHEKAKVQIGDRVPVITTTVSGGAGGFASTNVNYLDVGLKLEVSPTVYLEDEVGIQVALEVSNITNQITINSGGGAQTVAYQIGARNANTTLRLKDGETQVLAGLINNQDQHTENRVPGLSDFPVLGRLFSSNRDNDTKDELVLLITPHIVRNIVRPEARYTEFLSGTDAAVGSPPTSGATPPTARTPTSFPAPQPLPGATGPAARPAMGGLPAPSSIPVPAAPSNSQLQAP